MDTEIKRLSEELYERILAEYMRIPPEKWSILTLRDMVQREVDKYNEELQPLLEAAIYGRMAADLVSKVDLIDPIPTPVQLSNMLYRNGRKVSGEVSALLWQNVRAKKTIQEVSLLLYEGYGFKDKEVLDVIHRLPKYLQKAMESEVNALKTKPLKAAYRQLLKAGQEALEKAMRAAVDEKARYYAMRIADTETRRAVNLSRMYEYLNDDSIELVKYEMAPSHTVCDICDALAAADFGWGRGIYPKEKFPSLPTHPMCRCRGSAVYIPLRKKPGRYEGVKTGLRSLSEWEQRQAMGSWEKYRKWKAGMDPLKIWNESNKWPYKVEPASVTLRRVLKV